MELKLKAFAKVNLFLEVKEKRADCYHNIDSLMQSVDLFDEITVRKTDSGEVSLSYNDPALWRKDDIIFKTVKAFFELSGEPFGLDIYIEKKIPLLAGLGGFSTDVAAVLRALNIISGKNYPDSDMIRLAATLGADVPFCYKGGTAHAEGIGEILTPVPFCPLYFVIVKEGEKQSTGAMYSLLDAKSEGRSASIEPMLKGFRSGDKTLIAASVYNAFELCWDMEKMLSVFEGFMPDAKLLSGSGPAVVGVFESREAAESCSRALAAGGLNAFFASSVDSGSVIE